MKFKLGTYLRSKYYGRAFHKKAKYVGEHLWVASKCHIKCKELVIGDHANFNGISIGGLGKVTIGRYFHCGKECRIMTSNHDYDTDDAIPFGKRDVVKDVTIGDFVWLGYGVIILPGTTIGEGSVIQAGSVVHGTIPPMSVAGGNPCKVFKTRNAEHFEKMKAEGKFFSNEYYK